MKQEMDIWCIVNNGEAPRKFTVKIKQLHYITNSQVETWIKQNLGAVVEWWS